MAAYISVPRDLTKVKSKVAFNLTKRQLVCFGTAALIGVPLFFVLRDSGGNTAATLGMMAVMLPAFFLGMYEKNGQPLEKLLSYYVQSRFVRPKIRPYPVCARAGWACFAVFSVALAALIPAFECCLSRAAVGWRIFFILGLDF